jgi:hypothetical protein
MPVYAIVMESFAIDLTKQLVGLVVGAVARGYLLHPRPAELAADLLNTPPACPAQVEAVHDQGNPVSTDFLGVGDQLVHAWMDKACSATSR